MGNLMPGIDYREVRARIPMSRVLELLGYQPKIRQGHQLRGPCPIHGSSNPHRGGCAGSDPLFVFFGNPRRLNDLAIVS
jgi:hypothetical protein